MLPLPKQFEIWNSRIKNKEENPEKCIQEIRKRILATSSEEDRCKIASKILCQVCIFVRDSEENFPMYTKLFVELSEFIKEDYQLSYLGRLDFYVNSLVVKELWHEFKDILPLLHIGKAQHNRILKIYFNIYKHRYARFALAQKESEEQLIKFVDNLKVLFQRAHETDQDLFIDLLNETFEIRKNFLTMIIDTKWESFKDFFGDLNEQIKTIGEEKNFEEVFTYLTKIMYVLLGIEHSKNKPLNMTPAYIKSCLKMSSVRKSETHCKILTLFYYFIRLFTYTDNEEYFNKNFLEVMNKFRSTFESEWFNETWYIDAVITFAELCNFFAKTLSTVLNKDVIIEFYKFLKYVLKLVPNVSYTKSYCSHCHSLKRHSVYNITYTAAYIYRRSVELNMEDPTIAKSFLNILKYLFSIYSKFECKNAICMVENLYILNVKSLSCLEGQEQSELGLEILDAMVAQKYPFEVVSESHLIYLYKKLLHSAKSKKALEMHCLSLLCIMQRPNMTRETILNEIACIHKVFGGKMCEDNKSICEVVEDFSNERNFVIPPYNKFDLTMLQLDACIKYEDNNDFTKQLLLKAMKLCENEIQFASVVSKIGKISIPDLEPKVAEAIIALHNPINAANYNKIEISLALAQLNYKMNMFNLEKHKNLLNCPKFTDEKFEYMERTVFKLIDAAAENRLIQSCVKTIEFFEIFYESLNGCVIVEGFDWKSILDSVSYLARIFDLCGYMRASCRSWTLVYVISKTINDSFNKIRAVSFYAQYSHILVAYNKNLRVDDFINEISDDVLDRFQAIELLVPRRQNYILICILNIALHYLRERKYEASYALFEMVVQKRQSLKDRNCRELVSAQIYAYKFRYIWMHPNNETNISPHSFVYHILDAIREIRHYTSEDSINIPAFLFSIIPDVTFFLLNRLLAASAKPYLYMLLKFATSIGTTYRTAQILTLLAKIDLQLESFSKVQPKLVVLDTLLMHEKALEEYPLVTITDTMASASPLSHLHEFDHFYEMRRKAFLRPSPLRNFKLPLTDSEDLAERYLYQHKLNCSCEICRNPLLRMIAFETGILHARRQYMCGDCDNSEKFFEEALRSWEIYKSPDIEIMFRDNILWMVSYYVNSLRRSEKYQKAIDVCDATIELCAKTRNILDVAYEQNFVEQKESSIYALSMQQRDKTEKDSNCKILKDTNVIKKEFKYGPLALFERSKSVNLNRIDNESKKQVETTNKEKPSSEVNIEKSKTGKREKKVAKENKPKAIKSTKQKAEKKKSIEEQFEMLLNADRQRETTNREEVFAEVTKAFSRKPKPVQVKSIEEQFESLSIVENEKVKDNESQSKSKKQTAKQAKTASNKETEPQVETNQPDNAPVDVETIDASYTEISDVKKRPTKRTNRKKVEEAITTEIKPTRATRARKKE